MKTKMSLIIAQGLLAAVSLLVNIIGNKNEEQMIEEAVKKECDKQFGNSEETNSESEGEEEP